MNKFIFLIFIFIFSSCNLLLENNSKNNIELSKVIKNIIAAKDTDNVSLEIFRDNELPPADNPNLIEIDTIISNGSKFYAVVAEYPDPVYNRFAIINSDYNVLLLDKSLNGRLSESILTIGQIIYARIEEDFISKGILGLKRLSLYSIGDKGGSELAFRTFTEFKEPGIIYSQEITKIQPEEIRTKISCSVPDISKLKQNGDEFLFDIHSKQYLSSNNTFDSFVVSSVQNYNSDSDGLQIISRDSLLKQLGIKQAVEISNHKTGKFSIPLSTQWNEIKNVKISSMMKKIMTGTKYINNHYGAEIAVIQLPESDSAENYINFHLVNVSTGNYRVRFSEKISDGIYFYQYFEYSCKGEKFLLILQTLKSTYENYKSDYQDLINSFSMGC